MIKNVLLVDDDQEMLHALKEGLGKYQETFAVWLALDGFEAVAHLRKNLISLVVTDLKMPRMDGFELLAHIMEQYPDVPVIIITGHGTPEMERLAREGGAVGYISKPFTIENLARQIIITLRKESEGGTLHNVSAAIFLQLVEMEQKTCTVRLEDKLTRNKGILFFSEGDLVDARVNDLQGEPAAHQIFSWDQVNLSIQNGCALHEKKIHREMQHLILEAARQKDEALSEAEPVPEVEERKSFEPDPGAFIKKIKEKIEFHLGPRCGLEDIYHDHAWDQRIFQLSRIGEFFDIGKMVSGYIDKGDVNDYIVKIGEKTIILAVNPRCPRDKLLQILSD
jgi:CheY-like chemotaxis protein